MSNEIVAESQGEELTIGAGRADLIYILGLKYYGIYNSTVQQAKSEKNESCRLYSPFSSRVYKIIQYPYRS